MSKVFVSYSRKDIEFARRLTGELQKNSLDFWIDWEDIHPTVDWLKEIEKGIEEADIFLFLISPDSAKSKVCVQEIEWATKNGKRLIPLVVRDIRSNKTPSQLRHLNWIFFRESDDFDTSFAKLLAGIQTDYAWVQTHRRLQVKALEWERNKKEKSFLLRGMDLQNAEYELAANTSKEPHPTDLQREYVFVSRKAADRQRTRTTVFIALAAVIMFALGVFGLREASRANESEEREIIAKNHARAKELESKINELSALAITKMDQNLNEALLLSVEAYRRTIDHQINSMTANDAITKILQSNPGLLRIMAGHTDWVNIVAVSPDGNLLASGGWDNSVILWDISNPAQPNIIKTLLEHTSPVYGLAFSPGGKTLASSSENNLILWDVSDPSSPELLSETEGLFSDLKFTQDGRTLFAIRDFLDIVLIKLSEKNRPVKFTALETVDETVYPSTFGFIQARNLLISLKENDDITIWDMTDTENPTLSHTIQGEDEPLIWVAVAISNDGNTMATGSSESTIALWDIADPAGPSRLASWSGHSLSIMSLAFSADGSTLASSSDEMNAEINLWDISNRKVPKKTGTIRGHSLTVTNLLFHAQNGLLISGSRDGKIMLWNVLDPQISLELGAHDLFPARAMFKPVSDSLATVDYDGNLEIWNVHNPLEPENIKTFKDPIDIIAFSRDGELMATSTEDYIVTLWDATEFVELERIETEGPIHAIEFNRDGKVLAIMENNITFWNIVDPKSPVQLASLDQEFNDSPEAGFNSSRGFITFSADGKYMASIADRTRDKAVLLWDVSNPADPGLVHILEGHSRPVRSVAFSPTQASLLASASSDKSIILWNVHDSSNPQKIKTLSNHSDWVNSIAFNVDGTMLASGSDDRQINLWSITNPESPALITKLIGHNDIITSVEFSPSGDFLASLSFDDHLIFWDINPQSWAQRACSIAGTALSPVAWNQFFPSEEPRQTCEPFKGDPGMYFVSATPITPVTGEGGEPTALPVPVCANNEVPSCEVPAPVQLDEFCVDDDAYGLYKLPPDTTFQVLTPGFMCISEKSNSLGEPRISCTGPTNVEFQVSFCNSTCANIIEASSQCEAGFGFSTSQGCCAPLPAEDYGCAIKTLKINGCQ